MLTPLTLFCNLTCGGYSRSAGAPTTRLDESTIEVTATNSLAAGGFVIGGSAVVGRTSRSGQGGASSFIARNKSVTVVVLTMPIVVLIVGVPTIVGACAI